MEISTRKLSPAAQQDPLVRKPTVAAPAKTAYPDFSSGAQALIEAYRLHGYGQASIDPLGNSSSELPLVAELDPAGYGPAFDEAVSYLVHLGGAALTLKLPELLSHLQSIYCGSISLESAHVRATGQRQWLHAQMEARTASARSTVRDSL